MLPEAPIFWDSLTREFVETAILELDAETLIDALKQRTEAIMWKLLPAREAIAESVSHTVGHILVDLYWDSMSIDDLVDTMATLREASLHALQEKSILGFVDTIRGKTTAFLTHLREPAPLITVEPEKLKLHVPPPSLPATAPPKGDRNSTPTWELPQKKISKHPISQSRVTVVDSWDVLSDERKAEEEARKWWYESAFKTYMKWVTKFGLLTREEEIELAERIKRWDGKARERMIVCNLRLVVKIAFDYANYGMDVKDLIQEWNIGLMKAVERFDPGYGSKFSTYGAWWIKQSIKRALANQSRDIRLPVHLVDKIAKMRRVATGLSEELGREPTDDEIAEEIGVDSETIFNLRTAGMRPASLDAEIGDEPGGATLGDIVWDPNAQDASEMLVSSDLLIKILPLIDTLDVRGKEILERRFGLNGRKAQTLEEVGKVFKVTRERIRQLQNIAIKQIRRMVLKMEGDAVPQNLTKLPPASNKPPWKNWSKKTYQVPQNLPKNPPKPQTHGNWVTPGTVITDKDIRFMMKCLHLGEAGCIRESVEEVAADLELLVDDVRATLADMGILRR
jgi:RNA polymerase primary sigma factor